jgi:hypothetical protein
MGNAIPERLEPDQASEFLQEVTERTEKLAAEAELGVFTTKTQRADGDRALFPPFPPVRRLGLGN